MSLLSLYIPDHWDGDASALPWTWYHDDGTFGSIGDGRALPGAREVRLVLPSEQVVQTVLDLPRRGRWQEALPYALEDRLLSDADSMHIAAGPMDGAGQTAVAAVERAWLERALHHAAQLGLQVQSAYSEAMLAHVPAEEWVLLMGAGLTLLALPGQRVQVLDQRPDGGPPRMLTRLLEQCAPEQRPARLRVRTRPGFGRPDDMDYWSETLEVPLVQGEAWAYDRPTQVLDGINLLQGRFTPQRRSGTASPWHPFRPALWLLLTSALIWLAAISVQDWLWSREAHALEQRGEAALRRAFPQTRTILDVPLQMQRGLDALRARANGGGAGELPGLLARTSGVLEGSTAHLRKLDFQEGLLRLTWHCPDEVCASALRARLAEPARQITLDVSGDPLDIAAQLREVKP